MKCLRVRVTGGESNLFLEVQKLKKKFRSGETDCWEIGGIRVNQGEDGLVVIERINRQQLTAVSRETQTC